MKYNFTDSLNDISRSMQLTQDFIQGMSFNDFQSDPKTLYAVIRYIEVIGVAVKDSQMIFGINMLIFRGKQWLE